MRTTSIAGSRALRISVVLVLWTGLTSASAVAQNHYQLFDHFNFRAEGSYLSLNTQVRLDSRTLGEGTTLSFEDDLDMGSGDAIPSLAFEWQVGHKHRLAARWQDISRDSTSQALREIQWGDEVIPIDASIFLIFDVSQVAIDYTYFPWVKERWAAGFGIGLRVLKIAAELRWELTNTDGGVEGADATGPLPYLNFEYRRMLSENWRFIGSFGWLYLEIGDIEGGQWLADANIEYLLGNTWSFGLGVNLSNIDVDWEGLEKPNGENELVGHVDLDINDVSLFVRVRF